MKGNTTALSIIFLSVLQCTAIGGLLFCISWLLAFLKINNSLDNYPCITADIDSSKIYDSLLPRIPDRLVEHRRRFSTYSFVFSD